VAGERDRDSESGCPSLRFTLPVDRREQFLRACREFNVAAVYLFGSRADDELRILAGGAASGQGSDLDVAVLPGDGCTRLDGLADLQVAPEDVFAPLRVDLVPLDRVDALFQFRAIDGHRGFAADTGRVDRYELLVMRRGAELLPIQRAIERERFGVATS